MLDSEQQLPDGRQELSEGPLCQMEHANESSSELNPGHASIDIKKGSRKGMHCQVQGCTADLLAEGKPYCIKKRLCPEHMRADAVLRKKYRDQEWRFCFQCGKLEPLSQFDGNKRSCRLRLQKRRQPPKRSCTWDANSFHAAQQLQSNMQCMTVKECPEQGAREASTPADTHMQQQREQLQQEYYLQYGMEWSAEDTHTAIQQQLLAMKAAAAAAPVDISGLMSTASQAPRQGRPKIARAITMTYGAIQGSLAACQAGNMSGSSGLMEMPTSMPAAPGRVSSSMSGLLASTQLAPQQMPLQPTISSAAAEAAASMALVQVPTSSAVSWPSAAASSGTAGQAVAPQPMAVQSAAAAVVDCIEEDLELCLTQMLQEFAGLDGMDCPNGVAGAGCFGTELVGSMPAAAAARNSSAAMQSNATGILPPQLSRLQHMHSITSSSMSAELPAAQMTAIPHQQQQQRLLWTNNQTAAPGSSALLLPSSDWSLQHTLLGHGATANLAGVDSMLPCQQQQQQQRQELQQKLQQQQEQQRKLQQLKQEIVEEQQRLLQLIQQQSEQLLALQQQQQIAKANNSSHAAAAAAATATSSVRNGQFSGSTDTQQASLDQQFNAMQSRLLRTRSLVESMHHLDHAGAVGEIGKTLDMTIRSAVPATAPIHMPMQTTPITATAAAAAETHLAAAQLAVQQQRLQLQQQQQIIYHLAVEQPYYTQMP